MEENEDIRNEMRKYKITVSEILKFIPNFSHTTRIYIGFIGSTALVIPGISGSMLLLIFGYYNPIVSMITDYLFKLRNVGKSVLVLGLIHSCPCAYQNKQRANQGFVRRESESRCKMRCKI